MGRLFIDLKGDKLVVSKHEARGKLLPDKIVENTYLVSVIEDSLDKPEEVVSESKNLKVTRKEFILKLLSMDGQYVEKYKNYCLGLYTELDMQGYITWGEVAYLLYFVADLDRSLDWGKINTGNFRVCVLYDLVDNTKMVNDKLMMYKNKTNMREYIMQMVKGKRYIPIPLYFAFYDFINAGYGIPVSKVEEMFVTVSNSDLEKLGLF